MKFTKTQLRTILLDIFWPKGFSGKMGRFIAVLSILALLNNSFHLGLSITFHMLLRYYDDFVRLLLSWTQPYITALTNYLTSIINLKITFNETWHHVFVVMWILFMRDAYVAYSDGRIKLSIIRGLNGLCISIVFSFLASIDIGTTNIVIQNLQLAILPYVGIYFYDLIMYAYSASSLKTKMGSKRLKGQKAKKGRKVSVSQILSPWETFKTNAVRAHLRFLLIILVIGLCFAIPYFRTMNFPEGGLAVLVIATIGNILYWVVRGLLYASKNAKEEYRKNLFYWYSLFQDSESGRFAIAVGSVFLWLLTFIALNTGVKILGL